MRSRLDTRVKSIPAEPKYREIRTFNAWLIAISDKDILVEFKFNCNANIDTTHRRFIEVTMISVGENSMLYIGRYTS